MLIVAKKDTGHLFKRFLFAIRKMEEGPDSVLEQCKKLLPALQDSNHKGSCGRVGIVGGSAEYVGAPYYAAISALRSGADLAYILTTPQAAPPIKSFNPELMVFPYLEEGLVPQVSPWLLKLHAVLIGPGLGRSDCSFAAVKDVIQFLKTTPSEGGIFRPIILDADGLHFLSRNPIILKDYPGDVYITPNLVEFKILISSVLGVTDNKPPEVNIENLCKELGKNVTVVLKGKTDLICNVEKILQCKTEGSNRRCGGQGDLLSGALTTFAAWVSIRRTENSPHVNEKFTDNILAGYSACCVTRACNRAAFQSKNRTMLTTDMIHEFPKVFLSLFCN